MTDQMEPIAIIGIGCRFPGAENPQAFWQLLCDGVDAITEIPRDRWDLDQLYNPDPDVPGTINSRYGGFLEQIDQFDPSFFGIAPREAMSMDPQQRLLLEVAWEALEDAGQVREQLEGSQTGVFIGISTNDYSRIESDYATHPQGYDLTGNSLNIVAGRLSYSFNFRGPSLVVDTACSSSLVAVHLACQSLWSGDAALAVAGGVNIILSPIGNMGLTKLKALSPDGRCRTFDARANGYVRSEGAGCVVLKPLSKALADHDPIYATVRGTAINHDGRSKGLTVPYGPAQEAVVRAALAKAKVLPSQISYVEAHGTGTALGDPIEAMALGAVLKVDRPTDSYCALGAVKSNIGHLEAAAGIASFIKVALALKHQQIPPSVHFQTPNAHIPFDKLPLRVQETLAPWTHTEDLAKAGISSFGFAGTNAHVVLEQAPHEQRDRSTTGSPNLSPSYLLPLSAHSPAAVESLAKAYQTLLTEHKLDAVALQDLCYTASLRRSHHKHRLAVVADSWGELSDRLKNVAITPSLPRKQRHPKVAFVFSGQGPQWWAMGRELLQQEPIFRAAIKDCDVLIQAYTHWSLLDELTAEESQSRLQETEVAQPAIFAIQVALTHLWRFWGIEPSAVVGHSLGEIAAAHVAGVLSLQEAIQLVCDRGRIMQQATGTGRMAAIELPAATLEPLLSEYGDRLCISAMNSPTSTVISGETAAIESLLELLQTQHPDLFCKLLPVNYAFHSPLVAPLEPELVKTIHPWLDSRPEIIPIISTVTGQRQKGTEFDAAYWGRNLRQPVCFADAIATLITSKQTVFLEISPHPVLSRYMVQSLEAQAQDGIVLSSLCQGHPERATLLQSLATLYTLGHSIKWENLYPYGGNVVGLPTYPWQREHYWVEKTPQIETQKQRQPDQVGHPLLGRQLRSPIQDSLFESELSSDLQPFLVGHQVVGMVVLPGAAYLEMALAAGATRFGSATLESVSIQEAMILPEAGSRMVQVVLSPDGAFQIASIATEDERAKWIRHAAGKISTGQTPPTLPALSLVEVQSRCTEPVAVETYYQQLAERGLQYGASFQGLQQLWKQGKAALGEEALGEEALGYVQLPTLITDADAYQLHPVLLDSGFQLLFATLASAGNEMYLPVGLQQLHLYQRPPSSVWIHGQIRPANAAADIRIADLCLFDPDGQIVAIVEGLQVRRVQREVLLQLAQNPLHDWLYELSWQAQSRQSAASQSAGNWLIFTDQGFAEQGFAEQGGMAAALVQQLAQQLQEQGQTCTLVAAGEDCALAIDTPWQMNPHRPDHWQQLAKAVSQPGRSPLRGIIHLRGLNDTSTELTLADLNAAQQSGCQSVLQLVQGLGTLLNSTAAKLWVVTRGTQPVNGAVTTVAHAPLWGLGRSIALEQPDIWGGLIDLDPDSTTDDAGMLLADLFDPASEDQLAFRAGQRYVARLVRSQSARKPSEPLALQPEGTYLITGGLGSLGLKAAQMLVERGARHLVLISRRAGSETAQAAIQELEASGAQVHVMPVDIAQADAVAQMLTEIKTSLPPLRGIFHAAGVLDDGMLTQQTWERFTQVMAAKVSGTWNLHCFTQDLPLDYFVMFSSISAVLGSPGQSNYAAANTFMDTLAHYRQAQGLPGLSINWGTWAEGGMAARLGDREQQRLATLGMEAIAPKPGLQLLEHLMQQSIAQVGIVPVRWEQFFTQLPTVPPLLTEFAQAATAQTQAQPSEQQRAFLLRLNKAPSGDRYSLLLEHLREQVCRVLGLSSSRPLDPYQGFFDLGMDSLTSVELRNSLQISLGCPLASTLVFDYPTLDALSKYLAEELFADQAAEAQTEPLTPVATDVVSLAEMEELSEVDAEALLLQQLENIRY
jgi:acyl transferase domain-containing protein/acyl carrier protein